MVTIIPIDTPTLGDRSYLAHDGQVAIVIDPQRDIDRVLDLANIAGVPVTHVFETHIHNDYVTGGYALAQATGAAYHVNAADEVSFDRVPVSDGDVLDVSPRLRVRVIATPGHTFTHLSYALDAADEPTGTLNFGVDGQFATYLGWLIPWGTPLTLLGETPEQVAEAQRELVRIGIDHLEGAATGGPADWTDSPLGSFERATFADLAQVRHHRRVTVLDVRRASEFTESHIDDAVNIPLHELLERLTEAPAGEVWVHCAGGYRASIAASVLAAHGHHVVAVDDSYGEHAAAAGLPLTAAA